jgi:chromosomal replication initiation ATPase DnaA
MTVVLSLWRGRIYVETRKAREIIADVAHSHGFTFEDMVSPRRFREITLARQEAVWTCRQVRRADGTKRYSLPFLGHLLHRDHTSILNAERRHAERLDAEKVAA